MIGLPPVMVIVLALALGAAIVWYWSSHTRVTPTPPPVAMAIQRIAFPGGIQLGDPERALVTLDRPDEIVIPFEQAVLVIDYPLTTPASIPITAPMPVGFTRRALVQAICDEYAHIYDAEEGTAVIKTVPLEERDRPERNRTDGAYGIWGHDLDDLVVTAARWTRETSGTVKVELHVEKRSPPAAA